jgi:hypothetical protein
MTQIESKSVPKLNRIYYTSSRNETDLLDCTNNLQSFTFKVIDDIEDFKIVKDFWISHTCHHYTDYNYYANIVVKEKGILKPCIIAVFENEKLIALIIATIRESYFKLKLGYKSLLSLKTRYLEIMYNGMIGDESPATCRYTINFLKKILAKEKIDYIFFKQIEINSNLYKAAKKYGGIFSLSRFEVRNPHLFIDIPDSYEKFLENQTSKRRHEIRRYAKRIENDFKDKIQVKLLEQPEEIDIIIKDTTEIASKTYQDKIGAAVVNDKETRERFLYELRNGRLKVFIMYLEGKPVAHWIVFLYRGTILGGTTGYLQEYNRYRPGLYLFLKMINYLCQNGNVNKLDFGFGDAQYKREFASSINIESNIFIYSVIPRGFIFNFIRIFNSISLNLYRKLSFRFEMIRRIKKKSRDNLVTG